MSSCEKVVSVQRVLKNVISAVRQWEGPPALPSTNIMSSVHKKLGNMWKYPGELSSRARMRHTLSLDPTFPFKSLEY